MNKSESKYFKTAEKMDAALIALIAKKDFEYITVKEICEKADVNRSTFYLHYENTFDLLEESIQYMMKKFYSYFNNEEENIYKKISDSPQNELIFIEAKYLFPYLSYVKDNKHFFLTVLKNPQLFRSDKIYGKLFQDIFDPVLNRFCIPLSERNYMMMFYLGGMMSIISEWVKNDCAEPIEKLINIIEKCINAKDLKNPDTENR